ncbi:MAG TPA: STAS domain-containing protein [Micromonosporaceae bacterium]|nr:STAS domain-containing protein [Micromonosporaceae bacterium]
MSIVFAPVAALAQLYIDMDYSSSSGTARVSVVGEVDLATAPALRDRLVDALHEQNPAVLDVDLAGVTFLDCAGVGALVAARNTAVRSRCQMRVSHPQPIVRRVLELAGTLDVLTASIDEPPPIASGYPSRTGPTSSVATQPPGVMVAA